MITLKELEDYLHKQIPITNAMGIFPEKASPQEVLLRAAFDKNINHKKTVFGGSLHAVAALSCWSLLFINLEKFRPVEIVITHSTVDYIRPVTSDFTSHCLQEENDSWDLFFKTLSQKKRARIELSAKIYQNQKLAVNFKGTFAALKQ